MAVAICNNCFYHKKGQCVRYPKSISKADVDWCGEWSQKKMDRAEKEGFLRALNERERRRAAKKAGK